MIATVILPCKDSTEQTTFCGKGGWILDLLRLYNYTVAAKLV